MKLDRLLSIIIFLLNKERASAQELAERFEVTTRTIYRDLEAIELAGIPIVSQAGPGGGYGIDPGYTIDKRLLGQRDLSAVLAALNGVKAALGDGVIGSALEKLMSMAPRSDAEPAFAERLVVDLYPWGKRDEERSMVSVAERAIAENRILRFSYASFGKERDERVVEPMTLVFKSYAWYLWGYCRKRKDFRLFKLARMKELRSSMETFERRPGAYRDELGSPPTPELVEVVLRFDAELLERVQEWFPSEEASVEPDGRAIVRMRVPPGDWMVNTFLGFGPGVEALAPNSLRAALAAAAKKIAEKNDSEK